MIVDAWRYVTVALMLFDSVMVPLAIGQIWRPQRTWFLLVGLELLMFGVTAATLDRIGEPLRLWYATPFAFVAGVLLAAYAVLAVSQVRKHPEERVYVHPDEGPRDPTIPQR